MIVASIDPGIKGCIVILNRGKIQDFLIMPYEKKELQLRQITSFLQSHQPQYVIVEKEGPRPGQSSQSMWTFAVDYGKLLAALIDFEVILIPPVEWATCLIGLGRCSLGLKSCCDEAENAGEGHSRGSAKGGTKARFKDIARALYPENTVYHEGLIDALLIGFYWLYRAGYVAKWRASSGSK